MESKDAMIGLLVAIALLTIASIIISCRGKKKEDFKKCVCTSTGPRDSVCQDTDVVEKAYEDNQLTEYTDLKSRGWTTVSPGDYTYPSAFGCGPAKKDQGWFSWDYTQFGST
jgi:hypothetical protein